MPDTHLSLEQLRGPIGRRINYQRLDCQIIEVLKDGPSMVLQECTARTVIQDDQYGEGHRRVAPTFSIPLWDAHSGEINPMSAELHL
jgi:hypothetical protein